MRGLLFHYVCGCECGRESAFFQAEDGIRGKLVTGVQTCALPISYTRDLGTSFSTAKPPAESPYSVEYPVAISLLLPVVNTIVSVHLLEYAINNVPRMRACQFSSVTSGL